MTTEPVAAKMAREIEHFLYWHAVTKAALQNEEQLQTALSKLFRKLSDEIIEKLGDRLDGTSIQKRTVTQAIDDFGDTFKDVLFKHVKAAAESGAIDAAEGAGLGVEGKVSDAVLELMKARVFEGADTTMARVTGDVMGLLEEAYDEGLGIDETARLLRDSMFDGLETWEAERIARTEIHSAQGEAAAAMLDDYADYEQWITAEDDRVRDTHADIHGQIVPAGGTYSNGLQYPGDMSGDIEEWINCRCVQVAFEMPAGMTAPDGMDTFFEEDLVEESAEAA